MEYNSDRNHIKEVTAKFIISYEKDQIEKEFQKQKIKQSVMIDLLSNRQKNIPNTTLTSRNNTKRETNLDTEDNPTISVGRKGKDSRLIDSNVGNGSSSRNLTLDHPMEKSSRDEFGKSSFSEKNKVLNKEVEQITFNQKYNKGNSPFQMNADLNEVENKV